MKYYVYHKIIEFYSVVENKKDDCTFFEAMQLAFDWANKMGIQGKRVAEIRFEDVNDECASNYDPLNTRGSVLWCKIECTQEERSRWEENNKLNVMHAICKSLE